MSNVRVYVLMGGMVGWDGSIDSRGMVALTQRLDALDGITATAHYWSSWSDVEKQIRALPKDLKTCVIGYSGGGSRLTWMTTAIDLAIGYDPSPIQQVLGVRNYAKAICYHNTQVNYLGWFRLGGGVYRGSNVETHNVNMNHLAIQYAEDLHVMTIKAVNALKAISV